MNARSRALAICSGIIFLAFLLLALTISTPNPLSNAIIGFDYTADFYFQGLRTIPYLAEIMLVCTSLGNPTFVFVLGVGILAIMFLSHAKKTAMLFLIGTLIGEAVSLLFKSAIERARPTEMLWYVVRYSYSFPSGHALIAMIFYGSIGFLLAHKSPKSWQKIIIGILTACIIFVIGFSRIFLNVHWASDVIGGWLLGGAFLCAIVAFYYELHRYTFTRAS